MAAKSGTGLFIVAFLCLAIAAGVMGYWYSQGAHMVTQYQVAETVTESDEFGDEIERTVMVDQFQFGLLPDKGYDAAAPYAGGAGFFFLVFLFLGWRARR